MYVEITLDQVTNCIFSGSNLHYQLISTGGINNRAKGALWSSLTVWSRKIVNSSTNLPGKIVCRKHWSRFYTKPSYHVYSVTRDTGHLGNTTYTIIQFKIVVTRFKTEASIAPESNQAVVGVTALRQRRITTSDYRADC